MGATEPRPRHDPTPPRSYDPPPEPEDQQLRKQGGEQEFRDVNWVGAPGRDLPYQNAGILGFVFGHMWKRPGLTRRDRRFVTLACVAVCDSTLPVHSHVYGALRSGDLTVEEINPGWPKGSFFQGAVAEQRIKIGAADFVGASAGP